MWHFLQEYIFCCYRNNIIEENLNKEELRIELNEFTYQGNSQSFVFIEARLNPSLYSEDRPPPTPYPNRNQIIYNDEEEEENGLIGSPLLKDS